MNLEAQSLGTMEELLDSNEPPKCTDSSMYIPQKIFLSKEDDVLISPSENLDMPEAERGVIKSIYRDDEISLVTHSKQLSETYSEPVDRSITSKLLHLCCVFDSAECASALLGGDVGEVPMTNEVDESGKSPLHTAAESHAARCVELLLRKRARTDLRTKDGRAQLPLELSLSSTRMDVKWKPDDYSIEDLVVLLGTKDLTTIRLLCEKTKEVAEVACAKAVEGLIVDLAALLIVAAEKIDDSILELQDADSGSKEKMTVYECVIREALSLGSATPSLEAEKRKFLLSEIELLHLFGVVRCTDKKVKSASPLVRAVQAGDEAIITLLLKTSIDIDDVDVEGNSALHWSLKASKAPSLTEIRILSLLLKYGARVSQKNKLGLTALHMAAGNGNSLAVQILLLEDPDGINYKTEMKETPLFFAVKNDHMDCAELLLRWGAKSEVLNLRRQRPVDLAKSQDMRFMLNPTNIGLMNRNFPVQQKLTTWLQSDDVLLSACETLLSMTDQDTASERNCSSTMTEICKYFLSAQGCIRGAKCFYAHGEEEHRQVKHRTRYDGSSSALELKRKIFVGGLPPSLNSGSLRKFFEEHFGPVEEARVLVTQTEHHTQSRGFGFITFKDMKSVLAAIQAHYVTIMDKRVEIKSVTRKNILVSEPKKLSAQQDVREGNDKSSPHAEVFSENIMEEDKPQQMSAVNNLLPGKIMTCATDTQSHAHTAIQNQRMPVWLRIFKKWFPSFLKHLSKHPKEGGYALSSLKGDFRAKFGLELDHASLGYSKLSDFMKCFSDFCSAKVVPMGRGGPSNHMVLSPKHPTLQQQLRHRLTIPITPSGNIAIDDGGDSNKAIDDGRDSNKSNDSVCILEDLTSRSTSRSPGNVGLTNCNTVKENTSTGISLPTRFLQFLEQDSLFHMRPWVQKEHSTGKENSNYDLGGYIDGIKGSNIRHQRRHLVLEAFSRSRKNQSFYFLRELDFYYNYKVVTVTGGKCFACRQHQALWANIPCKHLLWCTDCKVQALLVAGSFAHKCVVCDVEVQKMDLVPCQVGRQLVSEHISRDEFPPFDPNHIRSPSKKKNSHSIGCYN